MYPCLRVYIALIHVDLCFRFLEFLLETNPQSRGWQSRALTTWASFTSSRIASLLLATNCKEMRLMACDGNCLQALGVRYVQASSKVNLRLFEEIQRLRAASTRMCYHTMGVYDLLWQCLVTSCGRMTTMIITSIQQCLPSRLSHCTHVHESCHVTIKLTRSGFRILKVHSLCRFDTTRLAASFTTLPVRLACHWRSREHVEENAMSLFAGGILFVEMISKSAPSSDIM